MTNLLLSIEKAQLHDDTSELYIDDYLEDGFNDWDILHSLLIQLRHATSTSQAHQIMNELRNFDTISLEMFVEYVEKRYDSFKKRVDNPS